MKVFSMNGNVHILVARRGEELIGALTAYCQKQHVKAACLTAIGTCDQVTISWYDLKNKRYEDHEYAEGLEITSLIGNIAKLDGKYVIHAHGTFARRDMTLIGGHIKKMIVSATCEIRLEMFDAELGRKFDSGTGLNLLEDT